MVVAAVAVVFVAYRVRHQTTAVFEGYSVEVVRLDYVNRSVNYHEDGRTLMFDAEADFNAGPKADLFIKIPEQVYFSPDYKNALSEDRIAEIKQRVSKGLNQLKIRHEFMRMGVTSFQS